MSDTPALFISLSRQYLSEYTNKLERALASVPSETIWWRPNAASNSIGNLLLHLTGSTRFWIVSLVGETESKRVRQAEFDAIAGGSASDLLMGLRGAVDDADAVLKRLTADDLRAKLQTGGKTVTVLEAVYHAVEHCSMHTGQILQLVKLKSAVDVRLME